MKINTIMKIMRNIQKVSLSLAYIIIKKWAEVNI